jgi:hypothetical protein
MYPSARDRDHDPPVERIIVALVAMTGRVTMVEIARWAGQGGSYRTIRRFFATAIPLFAHGLWDSAVNRADFALFQAAICALERRGIRRRAWTSKGVHSDFVQLFVRRRKLVPASFAGALPSVMPLRHIADYQQPGMS